MRLSNYQRHFLWVISTMLVIFATGCRRELLHQRAYERASAIIDSVPEEALAILDSIPPSTLQAGLDSARYILLHATAENKLHRISTTTSALDSILGVFRKENSPSEIRHAEFLLGRFLAAEGKTAAAVRHLLEAENLIDFSTPAYERGLIYNELAECSNSLYSPVIAIRYIEKAEGAFSAARLWPHLLYALHDHASYLNNVGQYEEAEILYLQVLDSAAAHRNEEVRLACYDGIGRSYIGQKRYGEALRYLRLLHQESGDLDPQTYGLYVLAERKAGRKEKADSLSRELLSAGNPWAMAGMDAADLPADTLSAAIALYDSETNEILTAACEDSYTDILRENLTLRMDLTEIRLENRRLWNIILAVAIILSTVCIIILTLHYRRRMGIQKEYADKVREDFISFIQTHNDTMEMLGRRSHDTETVIKSLMGRHTETVNTLTKTLYGKSNSGATIETITVKLIDDLLAQLSGDERLQKEFEDTINLRHNGALVDLQEQVPDLSVEDIRLFVLCAFGFSNLVISRILDIGNPPYVSVKKTFLRRKIRESGAARSEEYLEMMG